MRDEFIPCDAGADRLVEEPRCGKRSIYFYYFKASRLFISRCRVHSIQGWESKLVTLEEFVVRQVMES